MNGENNGKYKIKITERKVPCGCHPETCCHFDGYVWVDDKEKKYLGEDGTFLKNNSNQ